METRTETHRGVPDAKIAEEIRIFEANPDYISHEVKSEGNGKSTITVTFRKGT
jgi:hypothetical protein